MKKIYGLAMAAALFGLASCSSDDAPEVNNGSLNGEAVGYIKMNLPAGTRANGTRVLFYKGTTPVAASETSTANVYALTSIPDRVIAFDGDDNLKEDRSAYTTNKNGKSPAVFGDNTYGASITVDNIKHTEAEAAASTAVVVYLDRVVAEVTTKLDANVEVDMSGNKLAGYTIDFTPEYVFVNGLAVKTPMIKSVPTSGKLQTGADITAALLSYSDNGGKGSHWTTTDFAWNSNDVQHFSLTGDKAHSAGVTETASIFERARQSASEAKKDFTHVVVAGKYTLTGNVPTGDDWDGTFYVYGANGSGEGIVYFSEADVIKAMGGTGAAAEKLQYETTTNGGMKTHMSFGTETCLKYDKGYVYYAAPVETVVGTTNYGKGVVRNHQYTVNVKTIKGWGNAIPDTDDPIIPEDQPKENTENYLKLQIVVNPFVQVANQDVEWK